MGGPDCDHVRALNNHVADHVEGDLGKSGADSHVVICHQINVGKHRLQECESGGGGGCNGENPPIPDNPFRLAEVVDSRLAIRKESLSHGI